MPGAMSCALLTLDNLGDTQMRPVGHKPTNQGAIDDSLQLCFWLTKTLVMY
jgi:hypothetical protein